MRAPSVSILSSVIIMISAAAQAASDRVTADGRPIPEVPAVIARNAVGVGVRATRISSSALRGVDDSPPLWRPRSRDEPRVLASVDQHVVPFAPEDHACAATALRRFQGTIRLDGDVAQDQRQFVWHTDAFGGIVDNQGTVLRRSCGSPGTRRTRPSAKLMTASVPTNFRLRWESLPASELFVVYSDSHDTLSADGVSALQNRGLSVKLSKLLRF